MRLKSLFLTPLFMLLGPVVGLAQDIQQVPAFQSLSRYDNGQVFTVDSLSTEGVNVLIFYDAGCGHCQELGDDIAQKWDEWDRQTSFYFVSMSAKEEVDRYVDKFAVGLDKKTNVHFLHDAVGEFITLFDPKQFPTTYLYTGSDGQLIQSYDGVNTTIDMEDHIRKK